MPNGTLGDAVDDPVPAGGNVTDVANDTADVSTVERSVADATDVAGGDPTRNGTDEFVDATGVPVRFAGHPARNDSGSGAGHAEPSDDAAPAGGMDGGDGADDGSGGSGVGPAG